MLWEVLGMLIPPIDVFECILDFFSPAQSSNCKVISLSAMDYCFFLFELQDWVKIANYCSEWPTYASISVFLGFIFRGCFKCSVWNPYGSTYPVTIYLGHCFCLQGNYTSLGKVPTAFLLFYTAIKYIDISMVQLSDIVPLCTEYWHLQSIIVIILIIIFKFRTT